MEHITASCIIRDHRVFRQGKLAWEYPAAGLADFLLAAYAHFGFQYPKFYKMDPLSKLGWLAAELLLQSDFDAAEYEPEDVAVVLSNSNASLDTDYKYFSTIRDIPSPAVFVYTLPNIMIGEICIRHKFKGENAFFVSDVFDAEWLGGYVGDLLLRGNARACIGGWVDVLGDAYSAALYLVERKPAGLPLTAANLNSLFNPDHIPHV
jgi:hypothetical protein